MTLPTIQPYGTPYEPSMGYFGIYHASIVAANGTEVEYYLDVITSSRSSDINGSNLWKTTLTTDEHVYLDGEDVTENYMKGRMGVQNFEASMGVNTYDAYFTGIASAEIQRRGGTFTSINWPAVGAVFLGPISSTISAILGILSAIQVETVSDVTNFDFSNENGFAVGFNNNYMKYGDVAKVTAHIDTYTDAEPQQALAVFSWEFDVFIDDGTTRTVYEDENIYTWSNFSIYD